MGRITSNASALRFSGRFSVTVVIASAVVTSKCS
jgi:hypothetical protein